MINLYFLMSYFKRISGQNFTLKIFLKKNMPFLLGQREY
jgi:hypothetical protein